MIANQLVLFLALIIAIIVIIGMFCFHFVEWRGFFDSFYLNKKSRTSHNIAIVASTGGGKSYTMKKILVNEFARQTKIFILDAENG